MSRKWWLALLALLFVTPALAQVMQVQALPRTTPLPMPAQALPELAPLEVDSDPVTKAMTLEDATALIAKLKADRREVNVKLTNALGTIEQMTTRGGSLVRAYCESPSLSRNTAGASEGCGRYICGDVDGLCKKTCVVTDDCAVGSCDGGQCMTQEEIARRNEG